MIEQVAVLHRMLKVGMKVQPMGLRVTIGFGHTLSKRPFRPGKARKRAGTMPRSHLALSRQIDADDVPRAAEPGAGKSTTTSRLMNDTKFLDNLKTYDKDPREHL